MRDVQQAGTICGSSNSGLLYHRSRKCEWRNEPRILLERSLLEGAITGQHSKQVPLIWKSNVCTGPQQLLMLHSILTLRARVRISRAPCTFVLQQDNLSTLLLSTQVYKWGHGRMWRIIVVWICQRRYDRLLYQAWNAPRGVEIVHCISAALKWCTASQIISLTSQTIHLCLSTHQPGDTARDLSSPKPGPRYSGGRFSRIPSVSGTAYPKIQWTHHRWTSLNPKSKTSPSDSHHSVTSF